MKLAYPKAGARGRLVTLPCCQRHSRRQRQQCGSDATNWAAALWKAKVPAEPTFQKHRMWRSMSGIGQAFQEICPRVWAPSGSSVVENACPTPDTQNCALLAFAGPHRGDALNHCCPDQEVEMGAGRRLG